MSSNCAGASMRGLTPEQIQEWREEIDGQIAPGATENQRAHAAVWLECWQLDALLAAAESVGKLEQQDWVIDTNYPCMGREIRPDSLVGIMDTSGDLVMALPLEDAQIVINRIASLRAQLTAIGKALRAYPDSDLASLAETVATRNETLEAQLTAREQENEKYRAELHERMRVQFDLRTAADAEVERLSDIVREVGAIAEREIALNQPQGGQHVGRSKRMDISMALELRRLAAVAPSQPPQTTAGKDE